MKAVPTNSPANAAALDERDLKVGGASHKYGIQFGGPKDVCFIQFQHGPRGLPDSKPGIFDDDLLAIAQDRMEAFQSGPFACAENAEALQAIQNAREALGRRVAVRIAKGVLGANEKH